MNWRIWVVGFFVPPFVCGWLTTLFLMAFGPGSTGLIYWAFSHPFLSTGLVIAIAFAVEGLAVALIRLRKQRSQS